ncbi:MAG: hypothetical protein ACXWC4_18670 [Telluria sp.]
MRIVLALLCLVAPIVTAAQLAAEPAPKPRTYALVAAMGEGFHVVIEKMSTGSHMTPYERQRLDEASDKMNQVVVRELARQVAKLDPDARFALMVYPAPPMPKVTAAERPQAIFDAAVAELKQAPGRSAWDRILIVTPAYRGFGKQRMADRLEGMGLFVEPLCQSDPDSCENRLTPVSGPVAKRPDGTLAPANSFFAPYFYATLWELDAATMEVIAKREVFQQQKMASDDVFRPSHLDAAEIARINVELASLVDKSMHEALKKTDLAGHVEVISLDEAEPAH